MPLGANVKFELQDAETRGFSWGMLAVQYIVSLVIPILSGAIIDLQGTPVSSLLFTMVTFFTQSLDTLALGLKSELGVMLAQCSTKGLGSGILVANSAILSEYFQYSSLGFSYGVIASADHLYRWLMIQARGVPSLELAKMKWVGMVCAGVSVMAALLYVCADAIHRGKQRNSIDYEERKRREEIEYQVRRQNRCCMTPCAFITIAIAQLLFATSQSSLTALKLSVSPTALSAEGLSLLLLALATGPCVGWVLDKFGHRMLITALLGLLLAFAQYLLTFQAQNVPALAPMLILTVIKMAAPTVLRASVPLLVPGRERGSAFGLFEAFTVTGQDGSYVATASSDSPWVGIGFIICGFLGSLVSLVLEICPCGDLAKLSQPIDYIAKGKLPVPSGVWAMMCAPFLWVGARCQELWEACAWGVKRALCCCCAQRCCPDDPLREPIVDHKRPDDGDDEEEGSGRSKDDPPESLAANPAYGSFRDKKD
eukprot:CAMPEP_0170179102 /NCGR_PEP_ID=MMETSP0040_2-20121228/16050_1 /TAXON_ID=641309 /ORGANISM="Lotharella oceanica, Strain CCMP622" /LENGTH=482 /DNA_ID=CAMNT_0010422913 /DNA_START=122 /DNA_END=1570 /DNA_ORIENTATION=+